MHSPYFKVISSFVNALSTARGRIARVNREMILYNYFHKNIIIM